MQFGLENLGSTCFLNSTIQALYHCKDFRDTIVNTNCRSLDELKKLFLQKETQRSLSNFISKFKRPIQKKKFSKFVQEDPFDAILEIIFSLPLDLRIALFGYSFSNRCEKFDPLMCNVMDSNNNRLKSIQQIFEAKFEKFEFNKLPKILILAIPRLSINPNFPIKISDKITTFISNGLQKKFILKSIICQTGIIGSGHAYVYCKSDSNTFLSINDKIISEIEELDDKFLNDVEYNGTIYFFEEDEEFSKVANMSENEDVPVEMQYEFTGSIVGICNLGSTCYMNSILQVLLNLPFFQRTVLEDLSNSALIEELKNILRYMEENKSAYNPVPIFNILKTIGFRNEHSDYFAKFHDLAEFLMAQNQKFKELFTPIFSSIEIIGSSQRIDTNPVLNSFIVVNAKEEGIKNGLNNFFMSESITYCDNSQDQKVDRDALTKNKIEHFPELFSINIARVYFDNYGRKKMNKNQFQYEEELTVKDFIGNSAVYKFHAAVMHSGSHNHGHFVTIIKLNDEKVVCDDVKIRSLVDFFEENDSFVIVALHYKLDQIIKIEEQNTEPLEPNEELQINFKEIDLSELDDYLSSPISKNERIYNFVTVNAETKDLDNYFKDTENLAILKKYDNEHDESKEILDDPLFPMPIETLLYKERDRLKKNNSKIKNIDDNENKEKRAYKRTSTAQRTNLFNLYSKFGKQRNAQFYSSNTGIHVKTVYRYLKELENQTFAIEESPHTGGKKSKVLKFTKEIDEVLSTNPRSSLKKIEERIKLLQPNAAEDDYPSYRSINRFFHSESCVKILGSHVVFKKCKIRTANANTEENKELKVERIMLLYKYISNGYMWVSIDETHWSIDFLTRRCHGWGKSNEDILVEACNRNFSLTAITAITSCGDIFCHIVKGKVDKGIFNAFMFQTLDFLDKLKRGKSVFWLDNCGIHNDIEADIKGLNHVAIFNAPGSPSLNPIEDIFGIWKTNVEKNGRAWTAETDIVDEIRKEFERLDPDIIRKYMEKVKSKEWAKALDKESI